MNIERVKETPGGIGMIVRNMVRETLTTTWMNLDEMRFNSEVYEEVLRNFQTYREDDMKTKWAGTVNGFLVDFESEAEAREFLKKWQDAKPGSHCPATEVETNVLKVFSYKGNIYNRKVIATVVR